MYIYHVILPHVNLYLQVDRLEVGKNRDRVYIYLHPGAIVNGKQVSLSLSLSLSQKFSTLTFSSPFYIIAELSTTLL